VFRAQDKNDLLQYRKAIEGIQTEDKFTLLLDGSEFNPKEHFFIGFGGRDMSPSPITVTKFLNSCGVDTTSIGSLFSKYLLTNLSENTLCSALTPIEWRMLSQVACLEGTASAGLYFLHDPFFEFSDDAKEIFADKWANLAWKKKHIVVVTELSSRPESWIDNDFIARSPLEKPRQATIGFGGASDAIQNMVAAVRSENVQKSSIDLTALSMSQSVNKASNKILTHPKLAIAGTILLVLMVSAIVKMSGSVLHSYSDYKAAENFSSQISPTSNSAQTDNSLTASNQLDSNKTTANSSKSDVILTAVSNYPGELQLALSNAVEHPESLLMRAKDDSSSETTNYSDPSADPFDKWFNDLASNR
jgi:hypothetical protein